MLKSHDKFHSTNGKRRVLVVDDELINREILKAVLQDEYEVLTAANGQEALEMIQQEMATLSLVLLDLMMPVMSGSELLRRLRENPDTARIPVIVLTSDQNAEVESLDQGATDFIPKPYPQAGVILARLRRVIELSEDRDIIQSTERDVLTGLYNKEYFYRYAQQFDQFHKELEMDAILLDINHFHMINERYGKAYGDEILKRIGQLTREAVQESGGIVCRREADAFMIYCPHREDYAELMEKAAVSLKNEDTAENRVRLRMGVYSVVDKSIDIEQRFDRAKMAADTIKGSFTKTIAYYEKSLHEKQLYMEQLVDDFSAAIAENQFKVYYQPKFDIRPDTPILTSAEALVRWVHPKFGMISPGVFIPLFEENGLIQKLDSYVWRETARQIRQWKDQLNYSVPISVNVSRIDMFDPNLADTLQGILEEFSLTSNDFLLEVTESAYTSDAGQIIKTVEHLRSLGFQIEMDDFGTGYSSLHMISNLPIDALKLDMQFIRNAFKEGGNTHMLEVIIGISDYLSVPVIAEGVETEEQLHALKLLGCDIVQGYFFSKPVPSVEFDAFILQKKEADIAEAERQEREIKEEKPSALKAEEIVQQVKMNALRTEKVEQPEEELPQEQPQEHSGIQLKTASLFFLVLSLIAAAALLIADLSVTRGYQRMEAASDRYIEAQLAASDMESGSDYLTDRVRCFVVTGEIQYLKDFFEEVQVTKRRDGAVEKLENLLEGTDSTALSSLNTALTLSNELINTENLAMRLMMETGSYDPANIPDEVKQITLSPEYLAMTPEEQREKAQQLVFDNNYMHYKDRIRENVRLCTQALIRASSQELDQASSRLSLLVNLQTAMTVFLLLIVLGILLLIMLLIRKPLTNMVKKMQKQEPIMPVGVEELRFVTRNYNNFLKENKQAYERLSHEASHDALTGLFNRGAYDLWMGSADTEHIALIMIDVDSLKEINDAYGHPIGDRVLKRVSEVLQSSFRSVDMLCRIGGDEFAVVMTRVSSSMRPLVLNKINKVMDILQHPKNDLPPVSLSVGVAFSDRENADGDIYRDADTALYRAKEKGPKSVEVF
ncbi:MAG: EAL domain-containing protein [Clostridia bacterium]|nr:EAL domain-containing protein [Clostridia bacterium]